MKLIRLSPTVGQVVIAAASLLFLWVANTEGVAETLRRHGISARSSESDGFPGSEVVGLRRQLRGASYGAGVSDLTTRRFFARRGQEILLDYQLAITGGTVVVSLSRYPAPLGDNLWKLTIQDERQGTVRVPIQRTGLHQLSVTQFRYTGTYDLSWKLE
jgi:hypothetical protein